jgi:hypothetical protein
MTDYERRHQPPRVQWTEVDLRALETDIRNRK